MNDNGSLEPGVSSYLIVPSDARLRLANMTSVLAPRLAPRNAPDKPPAPHLTCRDTPRQVPRDRVSRNHVMSSHMHTVPSRITPAVSRPVYRDGLALERAVQPTRTKMQGYWASARKGGGGCTACRMSVVP